MGGEREISKSKQQRQKRKARLPTRTTITAILQQQTRAAVETTPQPHTQCVYVNTLTRLDIYLTQKKYRRGNRERAGHAKRGYVNSYRPIYLLYLGIQRDRNHQSCKPSRENASQTHPPTVYSKVLQSLNGKRFPHFTFYLVIGSTWPLVR